MIGFLLVCPKRLYTYCTWEFGEGWLILIVLVRPKTQRVERAKTKNFDIGEDLILHNRNEFHYTTTLAISFRVENGQFAGAVCVIGLTEATTLASCQPRRWSAPTSILLHCFPRPNRKRLAAESGK